MGFTCGIVGLPNVGKSTLFNALTASEGAAAMNFPFCTIEPNVGKAFVPDDRLVTLAEIAHAAKVIPSTIDFVDIAGLVEGASKGEGLGNRFLGHIREVDAIVHVVRCFAGDEVTHVQGKVDPLDDIDTVMTELILADIESVEKRIHSHSKKARGGEKESKEMVEVFTRVLQTLEKGEIAYKTEGIAPKMMKQLGLVTGKPVVYVANVDEDALQNGNDWSKTLEEKAAQEGFGCFRVCVALEEAVSKLTGDEQKEFLELYQMDDSGLKKLIRAGYDLLGLLTFFTAGAKEAKSWTIKKGSTAQNAAGAIHTDFAKGFIFAETISYNDYVSYNGEQGAKDAGKLRMEGRDYIVNEADVLHFRFNV